MTFPFKVTLQRWHKPLLIPAMLLAMLCTHQAAAAVNTVDISTDSTNNGAWTLSEAAQFSQNVQGLDYWVASSGYYVSPGSGLFTASLSFNASSPLANSAVVHINSFGADDRAELLLNGVLIDAVGAFAPGTGYFQSTPNGPFVQTSFNPENGALTVSNLSLLQGLNTVEIILNNTRAGISPDYITPVSADDPAAVGLIASISYISAVPEPEAWFMLSLGLPLLGWIKGRKAA